MIITVFRAYTHMCSRSHSVCCRCVLRTPKLTGNHCGMVAARAAYLIATAGACCGTAISTYPDIKRMDYQCIKQVQSGGGGRGRGQGALVVSKAGMTVFRMHVWFPSSTTEDEYLLFCLLGTPRTCVGRKTPRGAVAWSMFPPGTTCS